MEVTIQFLQSPDDKLIVIEVPTPEDGNDNSLREELLINVIEKIYTTSKIKTYPQTDNLFRP